MKPCNELSQPLVGFYRGECADQSGRSIGAILSWGDGEPESVHDYIQWLFPLTSRSGANPAAPVLDQAQTEIFRADGTLKNKVLESLTLMLSFYGLQCERAENVVRVRKRGNYAEKKRAWLYNGSHNYLRITRILASLRLMGLEEYAHAFFTCLDKIYEEERRHIGDATYRFWKGAAGHLD
jgi:hypothetical protein